MTPIEVIKQALAALDSCDWADNDFPDDTQFFDRIAVCEAATTLRTFLKNIKEVRDME